MDTKMVQDIIRLLPVFDRDGYHIKGKTYHDVFYGTNDGTLINITFHVHSYHCKEPIAARKVKLH